MSDIAEKVLAKIAAKETQASAAGRGEWFLAASDRVEMHCVNLTHVGLSEFDIHVADTEGADEFAAFMVDNQPTDVLRRCAADREIVELHSPKDVGNPFSLAQGLCGTCLNFEGATYPCATIAALARGHGLEVGE